MSKMRLRETDLAVLSKRLIRQTDELAVETNITQLIDDLKMVKNSQMAVCFLALIGLAFAIRVNEYCDRGYQPIPVTSLFR